MSSVSHHDYPVRKLSHKEIKQLAPDHIDIVKGQSLDVIPSSLAPELEFELLATVS